MRMDISFVDPGRLQKINLVLLVKHLYKYRKADLQTQQVHTFSLIWPVVSGMSETLEK